ncbi:MAG TPA: AI-2E family transporter [Eubacterium sp.]|nr:AI-2E family transporter [Eubacterium sp.]
MKKKNDISKTIKDVVSNIQPSAVTDDKAASENPNIETSPPPRRFKANKKYFTISVYAIGIILVAAIIWKVINITNFIKIMKDFFRLISPFLAGAFIAFLLNPMVNFFHDKFFTRFIKIKNSKAKKILSILITYVIFIGFIVVLLAFVIPQIISSLRDLATKIPHWLDRIVDSIRIFAERHPNLDLDIDAIEETIYKNSSLELVIERLSNFMPDIFSFLLTTSITIIKLIFNTLIAIIVSIYIIADKKELSHGFRRILYAFFPSHATSEIIDILKETNSVFGGFIFGKAVDSLIIGMLCFILMTILGLDYAVLISVMVGITNMIPYFGPYIGGAVGMLILIISSPVKALIFGIMILALQQFDGLYLGPKILGKSIGIRPLWIIVSITIGGNTFGILGMFLGVPVFTVMLYIFEKIVDRLLKKKKLTFDENITDLNHHIKQE